MVLAKMCLKKPPIITIQISITTLEEAKKAYTGVEYPRIMIKPILYSFLWQKQECEAARFIGLMNLWVKVQTKISMRLGQWLSVAAQKGDILLQLSCLKNINHVSLIPKFLIRKKNRNLKNQVQFNLREWDGILKSTTSQYPF